MPVLLTLQPFAPTLIFLIKARDYLGGALVGEDVLQAWPENVRLGWKKLAVTNALNCSSAVLVVSVKKVL